MTNRTMDTDGEQSIAEAAKLLGVSPDAVRHIVVAFQRSTAVQATTADMIDRINRRFRAKAEALC